VSRAEQATRGGLELEATQASARAVPDLAGSLVKDRRRGGVLAKSVSSIKGASHGRTRVLYEVYASSHRGAECGGKGRFCSEQKAVTHPARTWYVR
jgi:hypothetical protein